MTDRAAVRGHKLTCCTLTTSTDHSSFFDIDLSIETSTTTPTTTINNQQQNFTTHSETAATANMRCGPFSVFLSQQEFKHKCYQYKAHSDSDAVPLMTCYIPCYDSGTPFKISVQVLPDTTLTTPVSLTPASKYLSTTTNASAEAAFPVRTSRRKTPQPPLADPHHYRRRGQLHWRVYW